MTLKRVVLDTNILVSAVVYGGKPRQILELVLEQKIAAVTSSVLISELTDILHKKFPLSTSDILLIEKELVDSFIIVNPRTQVSLLKDNPDNRILEAASTGNCQYIVTGDKELLKLGRYKRIKIVTAANFLSDFAKNESK